MATAGYPSDLSAAQWALIEPHIPPAKPGGRPRQTDMYAIVNAIFYLLRTGCQWRLLPIDFPPWGTVWWYFRCWREDGVWVRLHTSMMDQTRQWLRMAKVRQGHLDKWIGQPLPSPASLHGVIAQAMECSGA